MDPSKPTRLSCIVTTLLLLFCFITVQAQPRRTIVVGGDFNYPPYSYMDEKGDLQGFDIDLIRAIAEKIDADITFSFTPWNMAIENLKAGEVDLLMAVLYTEERSQYFDFSIPYNSDSYSIFSREGSGITGVNDLQGKKVAMLQGDASIEMFIKPLGLLSDITFATSYPEAFEFLLTHQYDYVLAPFSVAADSLKQMEQERGLDLGIVSTGQPLLPSLYRLAVKKGDPLLLTQLNDSLDALKSEGKIQKLRDKWIINRPTNWPLKKVVKSFLMVLIPVTLIVLFALLWGWSLRREVKKKSESLREALHQAKSASLAKSRFLANMNHEIRTPLNAISGFSQALMIDIQKYSLGDDYYKIAKNIHTAGENLSDIINNILELSKIQAEHRPLQVEVFNLKKTIQGIYGLNKLRALKQGIIFNYGYDADLPEVVQSDKTALTRILTILVENAIKFTPSGKSIWLKLKRENDQLRIQLEDDGIGIDETYLEKIFAPFEQVDDSMTKKYGGTGLGLTIAKAYVMLLSGTISAENQKGQGTVFNVVLPLNLEC